MATYIEINTSNGNLERRTPITTSAGAGDASKIAQTNGSGKFDVTLLPSEALSGATIIDVVASEAISEDDLINLWNDSGTLKVRRADATNARKAFGIARATAASPGDTISVEIGDHDFTDTGHGFTIAAQLFLSTTAGQFSATPPSTDGQIVQQVGFAIDANTIRVELRQPITL